MTEDQRLDIPQRLECFLNGGLCGSLLGAFGSAVGTIVTGGALLGVYAAGLGVAIATALTSPDQRKQGSYVAGAFTGYALGGVLLGMALGMVPPEGWQDKWQDRMDGPTAAIVVDAWRPALAPITADGAQNLRIEMAAAPSLSPAIAGGIRALQPL